MRRTKEDAEETRQDIIKAATQVFATSGFARSTLDEIAKRANVTRGAIYWHFKNKGEIFDAIHRNLNQEFLDIVQAELSDNDYNPIEQLKKLAIKLMQDLEHDEPKKQALVLFLIKADYSGDLAIYKEQHRKEKIKSTAIFQNSFQRAIDKNIISSNYDPEILAQTLSCLMRGMLLEYLLQPEDFNIKLKSEQIFNLFFESLNGAVFLN